jgi:hypothetical protein
MAASLSSTNPYLRDRNLRERTITRSVATSSAIEGIRAFFKRPVKASGSPAKPKRQKKS